MTQQARFVPQYNTTTNVAEFKTAWKVPSTAPVLSGITLINLGTTFGTPRVTITFS